MTKYRGKIDNPHNFPIPKIPFGTNDLAADVAATRQRIFTDLASLVAFLFGRTGDPLAEPDRKGESFYPGKMFDTENGLRYPAGMLPTLENRMMDSFGWIKFVGKPLADEVAELRRRVAELERKLGSAK